MDDMDEKVKRGKLKDKLKNLFAESVSDFRANELATAIEVSINTNTPFYTDTKAYLLKGRDLVFNLQQNARLREMLYSGGLKPKDLVNKSSDELATKKTEEETLVFGIPRW
jgi:Transcription factor S-II (TFIIS), central domain